MEVEHFASLLMEDQKLEYKSTHEKLLIIFIINKFFSFHVKNKKHFLL